MKQKGATKQGNRFRLSGGIAATLTALVGLTLFLFPIGGGITRSSFDLPFALRADLTATNVAIVYMDEASHTELHQPTTAPWDRSLHAKLVEQLTAQGAKAIVFDILFTDPSASQSADDAFARAIKKSGRVILAGNYQNRETVPGAMGRWEELPYEPFRTVAAGWGNVNLPVDPDYGIRRFFPTIYNISGQKTVLWMPVAAAKLAGASDQMLRPDAIESRLAEFLRSAGNVARNQLFSGVDAGWPAARIFQGQNCLRRCANVRRLFRQGQGRVSHPLRVLGKRVCARSGNSGDLDFESDTRQLAEPAAILIGIIFNSSLWPHSRALV